MGSKAEPATALKSAAERRSSPAPPRRQFGHATPFPRGLGFAFKRMDKVTAEKGYAGPVVVCSVSYEPIAGHRPYPLIKYLSEGREIEMALAPVAGTRLLAPFRMLVESVLANLVIEANQFEVTAQPQDTSTVADPKAQ